MWAQDLLSIRVKDKIATPACESLSSARVRLTKAACAMLGVGGAAARGRVLPGVRWIAQTARTPATTRHWLQSGPDTVTSDTTAYTAYTVDIGGYRENIWYN